ncbi:RHOMBOID-like protein 1 isoform X3 [Beta vulgaris subsp. vulgaris]|uniref:RHOMBOID-like protein 1 isoform X3 n=1 Tax=Beta vulgaris subsp. vulgaris TaxID=3555 RepID=UPI00053F398C|nr:RHOMBOID-like protein 1 isoform X3 [Beta vulgaris subsp. vulgaris]
MPRPPAPETEFRPFKRWAAWVVPSFVVVNVVLFLITMYVNDCPKYSLSCFARFLGRFSFQPLKENPLLGPSAAALEKMGALEVSKVVGRHQAWRLITSIWLHAGVVHIFANMLSLVFIGIRLEQEFGFVKIGLLYLISGFGANILSSLFLQSTISVGASGALFGLLGAMLSELLTNWTIYANKFGWVSQKHTRPGSCAASSKPKHKPYQYVLWTGAAVLLIGGMTGGLVMLFRGVSGNDFCSWCHYMSCFPTAKWSCKPQEVLCESTELGSQLNVTCLSNGRSHIYPSTDANSSRVRQLCSQLCS